MRYRTAAELQATNAHLYRTNDDLRAHITRLAVILERKNPTAADRRWLDSAMAAAFVTAEQIEAITNRTAPWPKTHR
jgi:hypothetical protein